MRLFVKIFLAMIVYSQTSLAAETFKINVCRAPHNNTVADVAKVIGRFWPEILECDYWIEFGDRFAPLRPEIMNKSNVTPAKMLEKKADAFLSRERSYYDDTECETVFETTDWNEFHIKYRTIFFKLEETINKYKFTNLHEETDESHTSKWHIIKALDAIDKKLPAAWNCFRIEVRRVFFKDLINFKQSPESTHYWVVALKNNDIFYVGNFKTATDKDTLERVLRGDWVPGVVENSDLQHPLARPEVVSTPADECEFVEKLEKIREEYKKAAHEKYNLDEMNGGTVALRALTAAGIKWVPLTTSL